MNQEQEQFNEDEREEENAVTKKVEYNILPICRFSGQSFDAFYLLGELFIDLSQKNKGIEDKTSFWNQCKQWSQGIVNKEMRQLVFHLDNKMMPLQDINKFKRRYLEYPDQTIHTLFEVIDYYMGVQQQLLLIQQQYCQSIKTNEFLQSQLFIRRILFDQCVAQYLSSLKKEQIYIGANVGPDLDKECFLSYNTMISESLCILLGKTLEQMHELYQRNGGYNYLDYESNMEITKQVIKKLLNKVYKLPNLPDYIRQDCDSPIQLRFITYDEITFTANVTIEILNMKDFDPSFDPNLMYEHSVALLFVDITPNTLQQIITLRQENKYYGIDEESSVHNLEYTLFAEIFQSKMGNLNIKRQNNKEQQ